MSAAMPYTLSASPFTVAKSTTSASVGMTELRDLRADHERSAWDASGRSD
jgi:hypothetical protein